jgi:hypothetical protein
MVIMSKLFNNKYTITSDRVSSNRWCDFCKSSTHDTKVCRRKGKSTNSAKTIGVVQQQEHRDNGCSSDEEGTNHSFCFKVDDVSDSVTMCVIC